ncbi:MAG: sigma-54-dependent Fis family transcriptional regulator [Archangium gephyra]|uniref:Sigma-54-dependent Fis family transcriptional regulator n=1 Tax=Archangium gephyra TaxID=48 RepID=A0A2W5TSP0_9BACT|nr:MAG: sigma-54-dependent Fis family transcriptional regulator [Archangium gephyra]
MSAARVLVVDDEADLCELLAMRLEFHGYEVRTERSVEGALAALGREPFDAMIVDLRLGTGSGLDVLAEAQRRSLDAPVIILTAHGSIETAVEATRKGAYGFLTKPFHDHELLGKVANAVESVRLKRELVGLRKMIGGDGVDQQLLGTSEAITRVREIITRLAPSDATVLVLGESGTGKELAARMLHAGSPRSSGPFVAVNCAAMPAELLESELFGHVKGAFTGAARDRDGVFAAATGGTLFLDEVGDAPAAVQVKLLRVLQERRFTPVGSTKELTTDVRVVAATNRDLREEVGAGRFREDLFYRLHVVPVHMPSLTHRPADIPVLARHFLTRAAARHERPAAELSPDALRLLMTHPWPGNVRELANVMEAAALLARGTQLEADDVRAVLPAGQAAPKPELRDASIPTDGPLPPLKEAREAFERAYLIEALRRSDGNVSAAARLAGRNRTDLHDLLRKHGLSSADFRES